MLAQDARVFFACKKAPQTKSFCFRMMKNWQQYHKGKLEIKKKFQGAATSVEDAVTIFRGLSLHGVHCFPFSNMWLRNTICTCDGF